MPEAQPGAGRQIQIAGHPAGQKIARELVAAKIREVIGHHQRAVDNATGSSNTSGAAPAFPSQVQDAAVGNIMPLLAPPLPPPALPDVGAGLHEKPQVSARWQRTDANEYRN